MKICSKCGERKPLVEFDKCNRNKSTGRQPKCKQCRKEYRESNKDKIASTNKRYYETHKEEHDEYSKKWAEKNRLRRREHERKYAQSKKGQRTKLAYRLKQDYGIFLKDYEQLVKQQNNICAICEKPETISTYRKPPRLSVDHDHITDEIRGLLCRRCNSILGLADDNQELLLKCINYLTTRSNNRKDDGDELKGLEGEI